MKHLKRTVLQLEMKKEATQRAQRDETWARNSIADAILPVVLALLNKQQWALTRLAFDSASDDGGDCSACLRAIDPHRGFQEIARVLNDTFYVARLDGFRVYHSRDGVVTIEGNLPRVLDMVKAYGLEIRYASDVASRHAQTLRANYKSARQLFKLASAWRPQ